MLVPCLSKPPIGKKWFYHVLASGLVTVPQKPQFLGWGGVIPTQRLAPLLDLLLHFYMNWMLRCLIFSCNSTWTGCSAAWSSLAILHELDALLLDLLLHFYLNWMLRCLIFSCISTWTGCSAAWSSLAILHELDAPLLDLLLHVYMNWMLRCLIKKSQIVKIVVIVVGAVALHLCCEAAGS